MAHYTTPKINLKKNDVAPKRKLKQRREQQHQLFTSNSE